MIPKDHYFSITAPVTENTLTIEELDYKGAMTGAILAIIGFLMVLVPVIIS